VLALTTLRFHDEVRPTDEIAPGGRKPAKAKIDGAVAVIESLSADWEPERYSDLYRERLEGVIEDKKKGKRIKAPEQEAEPQPAPDLMAALQDTLDRMGSGSKKKKTAARGNGGGDGLEKLSREELYERAQAEDVPGRSKMSKDELIAALDG
jgi:DNA end-binding protein Ku